MTAIVTRSRTLRRGGLPLITATATVLAVTSFAAPAPAPAFAADGTTPAAASYDIVDGTLDWGVKQSFRNYITSPIAHGEITLADGAEEHPETGFRFTGGSGSYDPATHAVDASYGGSVHFTGHGGLLDLKLAELRVVTEGTESGAIVADVTVAGVTTQDVEFADLDLTPVTPGQGEAGALVLAAIPATLTAAGAEAFEYNGQPMYPEGTALDPATVTVTAEPGGEDPGGEDPGGEDPGGEDPGDTGTVHGGTLDWGVKESFRGYVTGPIASGDVELTGGATELADGYRFPGAEGTFGTQEPALDAGFDGGVRFTGHDGALDLSFTGLSVEVTGSGAELTADVASKDRDTGVVNEYEDIAVAALDVPSGALTPDGDVLTLDAVPATLTADGAEAFAGFYAAGEELDPVTVTLALTAGADLPDGDGGDSGGGHDDGGPSPQTGSTSATGGATGGVLADTGSGTPALGLTLGAAALIAAGAAASYATLHRRRLPES